MKITDVRTLCLSRMHEPERQWFTSRYRTVKADGAIVLIRTDGGLTGVGEACAYGVPARIREWVAWYAPFLVGCDPEDASLAPAPHNRSWQHDCAAAGIDCGLWDLRGKIAGRRVSELVGARPQERVRLYASSGCRYDWRVRPEQLIEETVGYVREGFTACKVRIGTEWSWDGVTADRFLGLMRELRSAVGSRTELMVDGNQRLTEAQALGIARELERLEFVWFEEPIPQADVDGYSRLSASVSLPITGGEQFTTVEQFRPYLEKKAYRIVQPDAGICGITSLMQIAAAADRFGVDVCPHSWHNGLMAMANAHVVAALPRPRVLELCMIQGPLQWGILRETPVIREGWLELPARPGLGVEIADGLEERFPSIEGGYAVTVER